MDLDRLKQILALVRDHGLSELEIEEEGLRLRVRTEPPRPAPGPTAARASDVAAGGPASAAPRATLPVGLEPEADRARVDVAVVKSPMVGTFYRGPEPSAPAFVDVGSIVRKGQVLCIIEAMKLMNEIDSEHDGEVVSVYVENGQPVQYGDKLFAIRAREGVEASF